MNLNLYDSVALADIREPRQKMFGVQNIGRLEYTNLAAPGTLSLLPADQYAVLHNWYARTGVSMPTRRVLRGASDALSPDAWEEWVNATTITLVLGCMPVHQLPLADLLRRQEGQRAGLPEHAPSIEQLAQRGYSTAEPIAVQGLNRAYGLEKPLQPQQWEGARPYGREAWIAATKVIVSLVATPPLCIVPARQSCYVTVDTNMERLGRLLKALPAGNTRVWVHLEGVSCTDTDL
jgi:hypothetical protein